jgi:hypothetical protein
VGGELTPDPCPPIVLPMSRSWRFRLFAFLFAPWFGAVVGDMPLLHLCPAHGSHVASTTTPMTHASAHMTGSSHTAPSHDKSNHQCTCLGCCCAASSAALPGASVSEIATTVVDRERVQFRDDSAPSVRSDHVLPFATAPPRALA